MLSYSVDTTTFNTYFNVYYKNTDPRNEILPDIFISARDVVHDNYGPVTGFFGEAKRQSAFCYVPPSPGLSPGETAGITIGATVGGAVVAGVGAAAIGGGFVAYRHFNRPPLPDQLPGQADVFAQGQAYDNTLHIQQGHECFNEVYEENNII